MPIYYELINQVYSHPLRSKHNNSAGKDFLLVSTLLTYNTLTTP